jgi:SAM-dependent methyltransferase
MKKDAARWHDEARFFDAQAAESLGSLILPPAVIERYRCHSDHRYPLELAYALVGDLRGKTVLHIGCGDGKAAVLQAIFGATVTACDISPASIELGRRRAAANGVSVEWICGPMETLQLNRTFDLVWCEAVLHHVLPSLDSACARLAEWGDVRVLIIEPVSERWLRKLRLALFPHPFGTPDERPLWPEELAVIRRQIPGLRSYPFGFLARFQDCPALRTADSWILRVCPRLRGTVVMHSAQPEMA